MALSKVMWKCDPRNFAEYKFFRVEEVNDLVQAKGIFKIHYSLFSSNVVLTIFISKEIHDFSWDFYTHDFSCFTCHRGHGSSGFVAAHGGFRESGKNDEDAMTLTRKSNCQSCYDRQKLASANPREGNTVKI